jgi:hypothetical protein
MPGEDNLRVWLHRLRRAAWDRSFPVQPRVKVGITRAMAAELLRTLRHERIDPTAAVDGLGRPVRRLDLGDIVVEWLINDPADSA